MKADATRAIITHEEMFQPISNGYSAMTKFCHRLNPGNISIFPWLSRIAQNYEKYRFRNLSFEYSPSCPTTTRGVLVMGIDYDPDDDHQDINDATEFRTSLLSHPESVQTNVWNRCRLSIPAGKLAEIGERYVYTDGDSPYGDLRLRDAGWLLMAIIGSGSESWTGDVLVKYTVELLSPQMVDSTTSLPEEQFLVVGQESVYGAPPRGIDPDNYPCAILPTVDGVPTATVSGDANARFSFVDIASVVPSLRWPGRGLQIKDQLSAVPAFLATDSFVGEVTLTNTISVPNGNQEIGYNPVESDPNEFCNQQLRWIVIGWSPEEGSWEWVPENTIELYQEPLRISDGTMNYFPIGQSGADYWVYEIKQVLHLTGDFVKDRVYSIVQDAGQEILHKLFIGSIHLLVNVFIGDTFGIMAARKSLLKGRKRQTCRLKSIHDAVPGLIRTPRPIRSLPKKVRSLPVPVPEKEPPSEKDRRVIGQITREQSLGLTQTSPSKWN